MASWLPETLFEIVGQGPAPSKDYYQLLVTRSQASARRGLPSLTPCRPGGARNASSARPRAIVARRKRPVPAPSREISLVTSASSASSSVARVSFPNPGPARPWRAFFAFPHRRPLPSCHPRFLPAEFPPREEKNRRPWLACSLTSAWEGEKERLSQVSQGGAGRGGEKGTISFPG